MAQVVQVLELTLAEVDLVEGLRPLFLHHLQPLPGAVWLLEKQAHIVFHLFGGKADVMERQDGAEALEILVVVLPRAHHRFYRAAQAPAFIFLQNRNRNPIALACLLPRHPLASLRKKYRHPFGCLYCIAGVWICRIPVLKI